MQRDALDRPECTPKGKRQAQTKRKFCLPKPRRPPSLPRCAQLRAQTVSVAPLQLRSQPPARAATAGRHRSPLLLPILSLPSCCSSLAARSSFGVRQTQQTAPHRLPASLSDGQPMQHVVVTAERAMSLQRRSSTRRITREFFDVRLPSSLSLASSASTRAARAGRAAAGAERRRLAGPKSIPHAPAPPRRALPRRDRRTRQQGPMRSDAVRCRRPGAAPGRDPDLASCLPCTPPCHPTVSEAPVLTRATPRRLPGAPSLSAASFFSPCPPAGASLEPGS